jgi:thiosulfate dehydrogenase (quinone) large subunit
MANIEIAEPKFSKFLFADTRFSWFWLIVRLYVGYEWVMAGWGKLGSPVWTGDKAGTAVKGFLMGALQKTGGAHPDVTGWYGSFIEKVALPNVETISYLVTYGEILIGIALILGIFTGIAAFFGSFMNMNFLFSGTVSMNPVLFLLQLFLILAWRTAGWIGIDRWLLPALGTPWQAGKWFR